MMQLDDLTPLSKYLVEQDLTYREALAKALASKINLYYVFDGRSLVIYEPNDDSFKGQGTKDNMIGGPDDIEIEYIPCDLLQITPGILRELWGRISYEEFMVTLDKLIYEHEPEGFHLAKMLDGSGREITVENIYVDARRAHDEKTQSSDTDKPSATAHKVIGLLMHHLAKSPKYASGTKPNKSQIKALLIDLAEELNVDPYGLNKVDERVLADAMKYLDNQKR